MDRKTLRPGTLLNGRYVISRTLGEGGFGIVYAAEDRELAGSTVALKQFAPTNCDQTSVDALREQFKREALTLRSLSHPRIPRVYGLFENEGKTFLVMDYIDGVPLGTRADISLPVQTGLSWALEIAETLAYLHTFSPRAVVHKDLTPSNALLSSNGVMLIDFGISKSLDSQNQYSTRTILKGVGTPGFVSPEFYAGKPSDPTSDVYALGATLYALLTGAAPADSLVRQEAFVNGEVDPLTPLHVFRLDINIDIEAFILKCLSLKKSERFRDGAEVHEALLAITSRIMSSESTRTPPLSLLPVTMPAVPNAQEAPTPAEQEQNLPSTIPFEVGACMLCVGVLPMIFSFYHMLPNQLQWLTAVSAFLMPVGYGLMERWNRQVSRLKYTGCSSCSDNIFFGICNWDGWPIRIIATGWTSLITWGVTDSILARYNLGARGGGYLAGLLAVWALLFTLLSIAIGPRRCRPKNVTSSKSSA